MSSSTSKGKIAPAFLQPGTVISSRAAIFDSDFSQDEKHIDIKHKRSGRNTDHFSDEDASNNEEDEFSNSILEKLYGQLQGSIEIEDVDETQSRRSMSTDSDQISVDNKHESMLSGTRHNEDSEVNDEEDVMQFRLFATQDTPTTIILHHHEPEVLHQHRERPELDESPGSERMQQIALAAIDATTILQQSKMPWERSFFPHKVILVTSKEQKSSSSTKKVKKSKRKREWEKNLKAGLIDQATIKATTRKVKVSDSWGKEPFLVRKGVSEIRVERGGKGGRGARGGMRGGRGGRGSMRGGSRGGYSSADRIPHSRTSGQDDKNGSDKKNIVRSLENDISSNPVVKKKRKMESTSTDTSSSQSDLPSNNTKTESKTKSLGTASTTVLKTKDSPSLTPKEVKSTLPPKKPKVKPTSKLDNIMAILTGK
ncbi:hypothetical protein BGZ46_005560 [Entomortierella lignicola]|nr:hypothetical protein BGZ46_005560 [Entomortierella lignicola]